MHTAHNNIIYYIRNKNNKYDVQHYNIIIITCALYKREIVCTQVSSTVILLPIYFYLVTHSHVPTHNIILLNRLYGINQIFCACTHIVLPKRLKLIYYFINYYAIIYYISRRVKTL